MTSYTGKLNSNNIPPFEALPLRKGDPHHSAWGLYGPGDELGALNRLSNKGVVNAAREEIVSGVRYVSRMVCLDFDAIFLLVLSLEFESFYTRTMANRIFKASAMREETYLTEDGAKMFLKDKREHLRVIFLLAFKAFCCIQCS